MLIKKLAFVVLYYGRWPWYWELWARSVANNPKIDFIVITDLERPKTFSENIYFYHYSIRDIEERFNKLFHFQVKIDLPHKICDYKSFYGAAFSDLIEDYDYWGYCDVDLIFGNMKPILDVIDNNEYDIISPWDFTVGHCTVVKNNQKCNSISFGTKNLESRLKEYSITFVDEGAFIETACQIGGFKIKITEKVAQEFTKQGCFLGITVTPACQLSRIKSNYLVKFDKGKIFVSFEGDSLDHEVLYFHFMSAKNKKYWKNYKGGDFDGCKFSRIGWIDKENQSIRLNKLFGLRCSFFNLPEYVYALVRGFIPQKIVNFLKKQKVAKK